VSVFRGDASEVYKLATDLSQVGAKSVPVVRAAMLVAGEAVAKSWRNNVISGGGSESSIPHYPDAIEAELAFSIGSVTVDVGPSKSKKQGPLGHLIEFGTETSPPHLHGLRAVTANEGKVEQLLDRGLNPLFP
jgi:hypothetical protein